MDNTKRLMLLGYENAPVADVAKGLSGTSITPDNEGNIVGTTHSWKIETAYYTTTVPIWIDDISQTAEWQAEFMKEEAKQVVDAIGAWVLCFDDSQPDMNGVEDCMKAIQAVVEHHGDGTIHAAMLAVASRRNLALAPMTDDRHGELEDLTMEYGFELVDHAAKGLNEYGERQGIERLREALEANDWTSDTPYAEDVFDQNNNDDVDLVDISDAEAGTEMARLKEALLHDTSATGTIRRDSIETTDQTTAVDDLGIMLGKLLAVREQGADLPLSQRKRLAAKAIRDLLREEET